MLISPYDLAYEVAKRCRKLYGPQAYFQIQRMSVVDDIVIQVTGVSLMAYCYDNFLFRVAFTERLGAEFGIK